MLALAQYLLHSRAWTLQLTGAGQQVGCAKGTGAGLDHKVAEPNESPCVWHRCWLFHSQN